LVGSPQPNYTFSNAFTGSTGLDTNSYFYTANNGDVSGAVLSKDVGLAAFADLTAPLRRCPSRRLGIICYSQFPYLSASPCFADFAQGPPTADKTETSNKDRK
jgi:hypothetical protein